MVHLIYPGQIEGKWAFRESRIRGPPGVLEFQHAGTHKSAFELQSDLLRSVLHSNFEHCAFHELLAYSAIAAPNCRTDQLLSKQSNLDTFFNQSYRLALKCFSHSV